MRLGKARRELLMHILSKPVGVHLDFLYFAHCTKNSREDLQTLISLGEHVNKSLSKKSTLGRRRACHRSNYLHPQLPFFMYSCHDPGLALAKMASLMSLDRQVLQLKFITIKNSILQLREKMVSNLQVRKKINYRNAKDEGMTIYDISCRFSTTVVILGKSGLFRAK